MPNYLAANVDPNRYAQNSMNNLARSSQFKADQGQRATSNALAQRRQGENERHNSMIEGNYKKQGERADRRLDMDEEAQQLSLLYKQADTLHQALLGVDGDESYQGFRKFLGQLGQLPVVGQTKFIQEMIKAAPEKYDAQKVGEARTFFGTIREKVKGTKDDRPSSIREYEYAKKNGFKGSFADWKKQQKKSSSDGPKYTIPQRVDDWRADFKLATKSYFDPEFPDSIKDGPDHDPDFYRRAFEEAHEIYQEGGALIEKGSKPKRKFPARPSVPPQKPEQEGAGLPEGVTEADIEHTMKLHNLTREQVLEKIKK